MVGKTFTYLIGSDAAAHFFNSKNENLNAEEVYGKLTTPVFGQGVAYDVPHPVSAENLLTKAVPLLFKYIVAFRYTPTFQIYCRISIYPNFSNILLLSNIPLLFKYIVAFRYTLSFQIYSNILKNTHTEASASTGSAILVGI